MGTHLFILHSMASHSSDDRKDLEQSSRTPRRVSHTHTHEPSSGSHSSRDASPGPDDALVAVCRSGSCGAEAGHGKQNSSLFLCQTYVIILELC